MVEQPLHFSNDQEAQNIFGQSDVHLRHLEHRLHVEIVGRGKDVVVRGAEASVQQAVRVIDELKALVQADQHIDRQKLDYTMTVLNQDALGDAETRLADIFQDRIVGVAARNGHVTPRTLGQKAYLDAMRTHDIVFAIGPAGTGKTYLAMAMAVAALQRDEVSRIILTRPAVEAGEQLGFLPGDLEAKITPYLRPLYDALHELMDAEQIQKAITAQVIEIAPLAYMRGRTLNDSFVIMDEAQNSTPEQMKMFLTRLGCDSKTVITGDVTQVDLPTNRASGLIHARTVLNNIPGLVFVHLHGEDVVRHALVQDIIAAYAMQSASRT